MQAYAWSVTENERHEVVHGLAVIVVVVVVDTSREINSYFRLQIQLGHTIFSFYC